MDRRGSGWFGSSAVAGRAATRWTVWQAGSDQYRNRGVIRHRRSRCSSRSSIRLCAATRLVRPGDVMTPGCRARPCCAPGGSLAVTDGAPGLIRAVETCFPRTVRQRCLVHRLRNLRSKAPESQWPEIAIRARGCYEAASPALAAVLRDDFVAAYERDLPAVVQCFRDDFDACIAHLRFPAAPSARG